MTALAAGTQRPEISDPTFNVGPQKGSTICFQGSLLMTDGSGYLRPAAPSIAGATYCVGVFDSPHADKDRSDSTGLADGVNVIEYKEGPFGFQNDGTNPILATTPPGTVLYAVDDQTVSLSSNGGVRPYAGRLRRLDTSTRGGPVVMEVSKVIGATLAAADQQVVSAIDVASLGASTTLLTLASPPSGLYRVTIVISAHTNSDTVTATVTYTDADEAFATTLTPISAVALTHDANAGTTSAQVIIRASSATSIVATMTVSGQTTTKASAMIERLATA